MATVAALTERVRLLGLSLGTAAKRHDNKGVAKWALKLADASTALAAAADPSAAKVVAVQTATISSGFDWTRDWNAINAAFAAWVLAHGHQPEDSDYPEMLGDDLFRRAVTGGYFGPVGTVPGLDYSGLTVEATQVRIDINNDGSRVARLFVDGKEVASEPIGSAGRGFDALEFAKRHGYNI